MDKAQELLMATLPKFNKDAGDQIANQVKNALHGEMKSEITRWNS